MTVQTTEERIRTRAYSLWQAAGGAHGDHEQHWHQAAFEIAAEGAPTYKPSSKSAAKAKASTSKPVSKKRAA
jgi:hypothetical protein